MATYNNVRRIAWQPVEPEPAPALRHLESLYRAIYIERISQRFRGMMAQLSRPDRATGRGAGDDPLRPYRVDLSQLFSDHGERLAERFEAALLVQYRRSVAALLKGDAGEPPRISTAGRGELQLYLARAMRGIETSHGGIVLGLGYTFAGLLGCRLAGLPRPWAEAGVLAAFDEALGQLEPALPPAAELAVFKVFVEEVLRHLGDACRAFREALPNDLDAWKPAPTLAQEERPRPAPGTASVTPLRPECASEGHRLGEPALAVPAAAMIGNPGQPRLRQTWVAALLTLCAFGAAGWLIYPDAGQGWSALAAVARDLAGAGGRPAGPFP